MPTPNSHLRYVAAEYTRAVGLPALVEGHYVEVDPDLARCISDTYELLDTDRSDNVFVAAAYRALLNELTLQWQYLDNYGFKMVPWTADGQPYQNSAEMREDVRDNGRLYFFTGGEPHPFLQTAVAETGHTGNEMLRAVHDLFGHAAEGYGFGPRGEENAWIHHSMMFSPLAQMALTTETRGQNSWVNFGPHGELPASERPYADQKVDLLPDWCCDWKGALNG